MISRAPGRSRKAGFSPVSIEITRKFVSQNKKIWMGLPKSLTASLRNDIKNDIIYFKKGRLDAEKKEG